MNKELLSLEDVYNIIKDRQEKMPEGSYVASLFNKGVPSIAQKVVEEGAEVAIAATVLSTTGKGRDRVIEETADLWFHSLVALAALDITSAEVFAELTRRNQEKSGKKE